MTPAAVIFDIDGTLVDSNDAHARAWVAAFASERIAVDYAAIQAARGHEPRAVLAIFPGVHSQFERLGPLKKLDSKLKIAIMLGDKDTSVDGSGARVILARLELAGFPASQIKLIGVKSKGSFVADHFSVMKTSPGAKAAIWKPADQLIDSVR